MFLGKCKDKQFFCGHNILTTGVFITELSSTNCVGYDKLPFHEWYAVIDGHNSYFCGATAHLGLQSTYI